MQRLTANAVVKILSAAKGTRKAAAVAVAVAIALVTANAAALITAGLTLVKTNVSLYAALQIVFA